MKKTTYIKCFECGGPGPCHNHHVIPRSLGGRKTVKLCNDCHGKVHGIDLTNHGELIRLGLERAKESGAILGRRPGPMFKPSDFLARHQDIVNHIHAGTSVRKTAALTRKGISTVQRVKQVLEPV